MPSCYSDRTNRCLDFPCRDLHRNHLRRTSYRCNTPWDRNRATDPPSRIRLTHPVSTAVLKNRQLYYITYVIHITRYRSSFIIRTSVCALSRRPVTRSCTHRNIESLLHLASSIHGVLRSLPFAPLYNKKMCAVFLLRYLFLQHIRH